MKKKIIVIILSIFALLLMGQVFGAEFTYKYTSERRYDSFVVYKDGEEYSTSEITRLDLEDLGIEKEGDLTEDIVSKIKNAQLDSYIEDLNAILNAEAYVSSARSNKTIRSYIPKNNAKPSTVAEPRGAHCVREEILAYNCNLLIEKLKNMKNGANELNFDEYKMTNTAVKLISYFSLDFIEENENKYEAIRDYAKDSSDVGLLSKFSNLQNEFSSESEVDNSNQVNNQQTNVNAGNTGTGDWWTDAQNFFKDAKNSGKDAGAADDLVNELSDLIFDIGNMIFIVVTSILGVKYIFAAAEGKAQVKDSLITLIVAALFFYGWQAIDTMLNIGGLLSTGTLQTTAAKLYNTILFIVNLAAVGGVIWIGVKYMLSSAEGKADIKTNWVPVILGVVMVYATVKFLSTIITTILG